MNKTSHLPVAVIGAGPIGLAAAAHLHRRKIPFEIFEASDDVAGNMRSWQHVPMFSPWRYNIDEAASELLKVNGWSAPRAEELPTGAQLIEKYLEPLAQIPAIASNLNLGSKVVGVSRSGIDKTRNQDRAELPFVVQVETAGQIKDIQVRAVIDASGTWHHPSPLGANGLPVNGEEVNQHKIFYGIPDVLGKHRSRYEGKNVVVIGGGHSAINALLELAELKQEFTDMRLTWLLRKASIDDAYGGLDADELPGRGKVGLAIKHLVDTGEISPITPFFTEEVTSVGKELEVSGLGPQGEQKVYGHEIVVATGLRPDLQMLREVRLDLDPGLECPSRLAPLIDPNLHSCGSVAPHGEAELRHPEKDFYIVGMKSYGRAPTFLLATGYEQVRSVVAGLAGDWEEASHVSLKLPETGVCGVPKAISPKSLAEEVNTNFQPHVSNNGDSVSDSCC